MTQGLRVGRVQPRPSERTWTLLDGLRLRQQALPNLMREAAKRGDVDEVTRLRIEHDQMTARVWAVTYTAVHQELEEFNPAEFGHRDRHNLEVRAARLAQEVRPQ